MRSAVIATGLCLSLMGSCFAQISTAAMTRVETHIPPQSLESALKQLEKLDHIKVLYLDAAVDNVRTAGASGYFTTDETLNRLLRGTGLKYRYVDGNAVSIIPTGSDRSTPPLHRNSKSDDPHERASIHFSDRIHVSEEAPGPAPGSPAVTARLHEVIVTGTHIHGFSSAFQTINVDRNDIDASGYSNMGDLISSLPMDFSGGQNPGVFGAPGVANSQNFAAASSANLLGLGPDATLTLINGHRLAFTGFQDVVDLAVIPQEAIQQVQITTGGASAIYGADAVAGVVNFVLRKRYDGADTSARIGGTSDGGATERQVSQLLGRAWDSGGLYVAYDYRDQDPLYSNQRVFSAGASMPTTLFPGTKQNSVLISGNQDVFSNSSLFIDALYSDRDANSAATFVVTGEPFDESGVQSTDQLYAVSLGAQIGLWKSWTGNIEGDISRDNNEVSLLQNTGGVRSNSTDIFENSLKSIALTATGPLLQTPEGPVSAALGIGRRSEYFSGFLSVSSYGSRATNDAYAELRVPLIGDSLARTGLNSIVVSLATRHEDYSEFGGTTIWNMGLTYKPVSSLSVHGTIGTSFRAPSLYQEDGPRVGEAFPGKLLGIPAPPSAIVLDLSGGNPLLRPETAKSWTIGMGYRTASPTPMSIDITGFKILYDERIVAPLSTSFGIYNSPLYQQFIIKGPDEAYVQTLISNLTRFLNLTGAPLAPSSVTAVYLGLNQNVAQQDIRGMGLTFSWPIDRGMWKFRWIGSGTYLNIRQKATSLAVQTILTGTIFNPPRWKIRTGLEWNHHGWSGAAFANGISSEFDNSNATVANSTSSRSYIGSFITVDALLGYTYDGPSVLSGSRVSVAVHNLFNRSPPRVSGLSTVYPNIDYDSANASPLGREVALTLEKKW